MRRIAATLLISVFVFGIGEAEASKRRPDFEPPVDAPVSDPYRPPLSPYGPGNRGIEFDTKPGQTVSASGAGTVVFSGWVGGRQYVTIAHANQLRSTYSWLSTRMVSSGDRVQRGAQVGTAGDVFHFGARRNGEYIDPASLFGSLSIGVALVAIDAPFGRVDGAHHSFPASIGRLLRWSGDLVFW